MLRFIVWGFPPTGRTGILATGQLSPKTPQQRQKPQTLLKCLQLSTLQAQVTAALIRKDKVLSALGGGNKIYRKKKKQLCEITIVSRVGCRLISMLTRLFS